MKLKCVIVFVMIGLSFISQANAFSQGNPKVVEAIEKLKERAGGNVKVSYHAADRVKTIEGELSPPYYGKPEEAAKLFLSEYAAIFQMSHDLSDIEIERVLEDKVGEKHHGYFIGFKQTYKGLPVFNARLGVLIKEDKSVKKVSSTYRSDINVAITPALSEGKVVEIAKDDHFKNCKYYSGKAKKSLSCAGKEITLEGTPSTRLGILMQGKMPILTYKTTLIIKSPVFDVMEYDIDANTGKILKKRSHVVYFSGSGTVFDPNPVNTLNNTSLRDDAGGSPNADDLAFDGAYVQRELKDLSAGYTLSGPYVEVNDLLRTPFLFSPTSGHVISPSGNFNFTRSFDEFEHVMVYYHIDTNQRYIQSLGFLNTNNRSILADPHWLPDDGIDNSEYVTGATGFPDGFGYLAFGTVDVDDAEDADVILHEYGHAIQDNVAPGKYGECSTESGAMSEGFGDYWAASNTSSSTFDPACIGEWNDVPGCIRRVDSLKRYPVDTKGECHDDGEIWSGVLWDMFNTLGKTNTDKLVLRSHVIIGSDTTIESPSFCDGAKAIIEADRQDYAGANNVAIKNAMRNRGFDRSIKDINALDGIYSAANYINDSGQVVGVFETSEGIFRAFIWDAANGMQDIGSTEEILSLATSINNNGQATGWSEKVDGTYLAFIWDAANGMQDLGTLGGSWSQAWGINGSGQIVGAAETVDGSTHAFIWDSINGMQDIGILSGNWSRARSINNAGQVVGEAETAEGAVHAFIWDAADGIQDLGTLGGSLSWADGINNSGQVVGGARMANEINIHAFIWDVNNGIQDIGTIGGNYSWAVGINDSGQVVGEAETTEGAVHAIIWDAVNGMKDLGVLGGNYSYAASINNSGQVVGEAELPNESVVEIIHAAIWQQCDLL